MAGVVGARHGVRATKAERGLSLYNKRETFLAHLGANCNVDAAAAAAGVAMSTIYRWRRTDPDFAANWGEAVAQGYQLLEARLIAHALAGDNADTLNDVAGTPVAPVNIDLAIRVMGLQRHGATKGFPGAPRKRVTIEEVERRLAAKLDAIARRKQAEAARIAELASGDGAASGQVIADRTDREGA